MQDAIAHPAVVVAGHICLDMIPSFPHAHAALQPGTLSEIGETTFSTGGVSNTAVALHRLGVPTTFIGKVGNDRFGTLVQDLLNDHGELLARGLRVVPGETTSYSYVISPPGVDRMFLHCPGANDTFDERDVPLELLKGAKLFHFGYPPVMKKIRADGGAALCKILRSAKSQGLLTSLDLTFPDPESEAGTCDWRSIFKAAASHLDLFLPSVEELLLMLDRERFEAIIKKYGQIHLARDIDLSLIRGLADELLGMGIKIVGIKLGDQGSYLRTASGLSLGNAWDSRELLAPCFRVDVAGTTGAGDCTIAGLLAAILRGESPEKALLAATAVGACCCEKPDSTSGVGRWDTIAARLAKQWPQREIAIPHEDWIFEDNVWHSPADRRC